MSSTGGLLSDAGADAPDWVVKEIGPDPAEDMPGSGLLSTGARAAAIASALPLVATYFASGQSIGLEANPHVAGDAAAQNVRQVDAVAAAVRFRVALASGRRLETVLRRVIQAANFRYSQVQEAHLGELRGRLDVVRYLREQGRVSTPKRYPVRVVRRDTATPENVLAAYAAHWLLREVDTSAAALRLPRASAEAAESDRLRAALLRLLGWPVFADAVTAARRVSRLGSVRALLERVEARLVAGHVARPEPYAELASWISRSLDHRPVVAAGDLEALFYGSAFDRKLFELWSLHEMGRAIGELLGEPQADRGAFANRTRGALYAWDSGSSLIEVFFQCSLSALTGENGRWRYSTGSNFRGIPDIGIRCSRADGSVRIVVVDPKLRQRPGAPTEEMYKLLGYFANIGEAESGLGGIIFHSPAGYAPSDEVRRYTLETASGGRVEAVGVDPLDVTGTTRAFQVLADLIMHSSGVISADSLDAIRLLGTGEADAQEARASRLQALAAEQLQQLASQLPSTMLNPIRGMLEALLDGVWAELGERVQNMLVSSVYFGHSAPDGTDRSGPVLGLCTAVETFIHEQLLEPALRDSGVDHRSWTLGRTLRFVDDTISGKTKKGMGDIRRFMAANHIEQSKVATLLPVLDDVRDRFRNRAAHEGLLTRDVWVEAHSLMLLAPAELVRRLVDCLVLADRRERSREVPPTKLL